MRKGPTEHKNPDFDMMLNSRKHAGIQDFTNVNVEKIAAMNTGRPLKERIEVPDGVEVFQYGG